MFDRYVTEVKQGPSRVDVHEHRAPTDDSVRLLREMEAKARDSVLATLVSRDNTFEGTVFVTPDPASCEMVVRCLFTLNGARHETAPVRVRDRLGPLDAGEWVRKLRDAIAAEVANKLVVDNVGEFLPRQP